MTITSQCRVVPGQSNFSGPGGNNNLKKYVFVDIKLTESCERFVSPNKRYCWCRYIRFKNYRGLLGSVIKYIYIL